MAFQVASLGECCVAIFLSALKWSLLGMSADVIEKFIEIIDYHSTRRIIARFVIPTLEETVQLLLLSEVSEVEEDILIELWDRVLKS